VGLEEDGGLVAKFGFWRGVGVGGRRDLVAARRDLCLLACSHLTESLSGCEDCSTVTTHEKLRSGAADVDPVRY
jgi:hypothetical protein